MNILITSAGRRGYIIEYFKNALGNDGKIYAGNSDIFSAAFFYADEFVVTPLIYDKEYIPFLLHYCEKKQIKAIISLFDIDLLMLARNREKFERRGIALIVSSELVVQICNDKWNTYCFCKKHNILSARTYLSLQEAVSDIKDKKISYPVFIKPRWGMGSLLIYQADNIEEMNKLYYKCKKEIQKTYLKYESAYDTENSVVIQETLSGQEYGMDIINDLNGNFCCNVVRKKYAMRAGETDCAKVVKMPEADVWAERVSKALGHIGNLDVDLFIKNNRIYLLEMNARFGGGYPFSHISGIDLPKAIIKWLKQENLQDELKIHSYDEIIQKDIRFISLKKIHQEIYG